MSSRRKSEGGDRKRNTAPASAIIVSSVADFSPDQSSAAAAAVTGGSKQKPECEPEETKSDLLCSPKPKIVQIPEGRSGEQIDSGAKSAEFKNDERHAILPKCKHMPLHSAGIMEIDESLCPPQCKTLQLPAQIKKPDDPSIDRALRPEDVNQPTANSRQQDETSMLPRYREPMLYQRHPAEFPRVDENERHSISSAEIYAQPMLLRMYEEMKSGNSFIPPQPAARAEVDYDLLECPSEDLDGWKNLSEKLGTAAAPSDLSMPSVRRVSSGEFPRLPPPEKPTVVKPPEQMLKSLRKFSVIPIPKVRKDLKPKSHFARMQLKRRRNEQLLRIDIRKRNGPGTTQP